MVRAQSRLDEVGEFGNTVERRRYHRLLVEFYAAVRAATAGEPNASLATCEKVPIPAEDAGPSVDYVETAEELDRVPPALEAIRDGLSRSRERQRKIHALIRAGEIAHAKRLANCRRKSVQLECPDEFGAGGCGSTENYVPVHCDSRLCPVCMKRRMGEKAGQYLPVVEEWEHPTMMRLSLDRRVEPEELGRAVDALRGAFGRLRRRVLRFDRETWRRTKSVLLARGEHDLARRLQRRYIEEGRGVPWDELVFGGFYGIDIKQGEDGTLNVHLHVLANCPYLPQSVLSDVWGDLTDAPVVDIRRVDTEGESDAETALMEVVGYAAKAPEWESVEDQVAYYEVLKGSKLLQPFGDLHGNTPESVSFLLCAECGASPEWWNYMGTVDGEYKTVEVVTGKGDRPPPENGG
jgi:hypothetical protein